MRCWSRCIASTPPSPEGTALASSRASSLPQWSAVKQPPVGASLLAMASFQTTKKSPQMITHLRAF
ncbi:hypothetical protein FHK92_08515 [Pseudomonas brassicacearum subsp. neoaurantiaca]|uniref:Uncharacterized protein n=1 Tax=Pseudomonas brassicacearum subsp. neoaurantiaca TaxID=494916 RepID=A0A7V8RJW5_9PSED|nr:hypothetical protein [Pseudomonas brassicacearum subsp. neoaurantiaca]